MSTRVTNMLPEVLIAENHPPTLKTTTELFQKRGYEPIPARNPEEAWRLAHERRESLAAIVLDNRLRDDTEARDNSGVELAKELRAKGITPGRIVIYTTFVTNQDRSQGPVPPSPESDPGDFPIVSKRDGPRKLLQMVSERISLHQRPAAPAYEMLRRADPPVIIFGGRGRGVEQLLAGLARWQLQARTCASLTELREAPAGLHAAMFAVVVDARRPAEGIEAIRLLSEARHRSGRPFYIVALSARDDLGLRAEQAGADIHVKRVSADADARSLVIRMSQLRAMVEEAIAQEPLTQHLIPEYERLGAELRALVGSPGRGLSVPLEIIEDALEQPFLKPGEKLVLSSLYTRMLGAEEGGLDAESLDLCIQGAELLARDRASGTGVQVWADRVRLHPTDFTFGWLDEEFYDDE